MKTCIYCREIKRDDDFTLEHVIPKFLGGAYAPDLYKIKAVCDKCNSNLGLFVDAGFKKNFAVYSALTEMFFAFFDTNNPIGLPLLCMGPSDLKPPDMKEESEICEAWLGSLGEQIYWLRPNDNRLYWYMGGNPRTAKTIETRAYFLFSERSQKFPQLSWLTFSDAFKDRRKVKKIMCTYVSGANPSDIGFSKPDITDQKRIDFFNDVCSGINDRHHQLNVYTKFDFRFLAKISIGIAYALFGLKSLETLYANELNKTLWLKENDPPTNIRGVPILSNVYDSKFKSSTGLENAVTLIIVPIENFISLVINIGMNLICSVHIATSENLTQKDLNKIGEGKVIILFKPIKFCILLNYHDFLAHKCGAVVNREIQKIELMAGKHKDFFKNL